MVVLVVSVERLCFKGLAVIQWLSC